ncbi:4-hydroxy-tetrahydrodipicolinate synthase [Kangiella sediminilitoris]|uniref:4-hydroxy-tetrahydrodipicolinate synthase n=1 Tax=Kangiella sediminilitoris TaxID=1144748 RepID=A0A1B3BBB9_9GAMM|nr:4-hydroxy-tetrahydrodipicolinate synthase [Kangiella sediminilitoris]AOE50066.1 dihydrodipicolinate synthase [Kangiella sediminilitoris]
MFSGSIVAIVTPMTDSGELDFDALRQLVDWHVEEGTSGIVVMGTTGESGTVTEEEYFKAIDVVVKQAAGRVEVIAGSGAMSTDKTIKLTNQVKQLGVDGALVVTPYYCKPSQKGLYEHFKAVATQCDLPIILYNVPGRTAVDLLPETAAKLAALDNIVGIKEATGDVSRVTELNRLTQTPISILSGDDATAYDFMKLGGHGVISVTANVAPGLMSKMCQLAHAENWKQAALINDKLSSLNEKLFVEANPIPVKWALYRMKKMGRGIRLPLTELDQSFHSQVEKALEQANVELS